ncbi:MAG: 2-hydroxy-6-oxo-6-phenylhexa-2,4-dienoate hydrolase [Gemmatimonadaceae bacterium]|nr:2-hydroxy-6-oxo-6-phenylhexa-2,4-dienoate hydrolase [Gemmatimonadaceae bacterium]
MVSRIAVAILLVIVLASAVAYQIRNPEKRDLDDAARQNAPGRFVALSDGITHYDVAGPDTGKRVILVHGFSVPSYIWDSTSAALDAAGFRVARYDVFGRGFSDRPNVAYSAELLDRQLLQLLDSLHWPDPVDVVGLSMGGPLSAEFTGRHPERVRSLTLIDPAAGPRTVPAMFKLPVIGPLLWQALAVPGMAEGQLGDFVDPSRWPDWVARYRVQMQYRGFGRALLSTLTEARSRSLDTVYLRAGATGKPALLIWGVEDQTVKIENAEGVRKAIPQAQYHPIDRAGHLPHMERADVVNPLLIEFLTHSAM